MIFVRDKRPFRFKNIWFQADVFVEKVKIWRDSYHFYGTPSYRLAMKLKALKGDLEKWNEIEFRNVTIKKMKLWNDLNALDSKEERVSLLVDEKREKKEFAWKLRRLNCWKRLAGDKIEGARFKGGERQYKILFNRRNNNIGSLNIDGVDNRSGSYRRGYCLVL